MCARLAKQMALDPDGKLRCFTVVSPIKSQIKISRKSYRSVYTIKSIKTEQNFTHASRDGVLVLDILRL